MKLSEIIKRVNVGPLAVKKTKKIIRRMDRLENPQQTEIPSGWRADPHQGSLGGSLNWR